MLDEPRNTKSAAEKLELLTSHAASWQRFHAARPEWAGPEFLEGWDVPAAVSGNIIVFTRDCNGSKCECPPSPDVKIDDHVDALVIRVASPSRRIEGAQWMLYLPWDPSEICIDETQDLLIQIVCVPSVRLHDGKHFSFCSFN